MDFSGPDPTTEFALQAASYALGLAHSWKLPPVADRVLNAGIYSAALAASNDPIMSNVGPLFERAVLDLGLTMPARTEAASILTRYLAERLANSDGQVAVDLESLHDLYDETCEDIPDHKYLGDGLDVAALMGIWASYDCPNENFYEGRLVDEPERISILHRRAREESAAWLQRHPL
ncbi:MAG: hypothetical protein ACR2HJ_06875 [Fimbriimonadales bacterium]